MERKKLRTLNKKHRVFPSNYENQSSDEDIEILTLIQQSEPELEETSAFRSMTREEEMLDAFNKEFNEFPKVCFHDEESIEEDDLEILRQLHSPEPVVQYPPLNDEDSDCDEGFKGFEYLPEEFCKETVKIDSAIAQENSALSYTGLPKGSSLLHIRIDREISRQCPETCVITTEKDIQRIGKLREDIEKKMHDMYQKGKMTILENSSCLYEKLFDIKNYPIHSIVNKKLYDRNWKSTDGRCTIEIEVTNSTLGLPVFVTPTEMINSEEYNSEQNKQQTEGESMEEEVTDDNESVVESLKDEEFNEILDIYSCEFDTNDTRRKNDTVLGMEVADSEGLVNCASKVKNKTSNENTVNRENYSQSPRNKVIHMKAVKKIIRDKTNTNKNRVKERLQYLIIQKMKYKLTNNCFLRAIRRKAYKERIKYLRAQKSKCKAKNTLVLGNEVIREKLYKEKSCKGTEKIPETNGGFDTSLNILPHSVRTDFISGDSAKEDSTRSTKSYPESLYYEQNFRVGDSVEKYYGDVSGVFVGQLWNSRSEILVFEVHRTMFASICAGPLGVMSMILNDTCTVKDEKKTFTYYGPREKKCSEEEQQDTTFVNKVNKAFYNNWRNTMPVRIIRSHKLRSPFAPKMGYRYDGLYEVDSWVLQVNDNDESFVPVFSFQVASPKRKGKKVQKKPLPTNTNTMNVLQRKAAAEDASKLSPKKSKDNNERLEQQTKSEVRQLLQEDVQMKNLAAGAISKLSPQQSKDNNERLEQQRRQLLQNSVQMENLAAGAISKLSPQQSKDNNERLEQQRNQLSQDSVQMKNLAAGAISKLSPQQSKDNNERLEQQRNQLSQDSVQMKNLAAGAISKLSPQQSKDNNERLEQQGNQLSQDSVQMKNLGAAKALSKLSPKKSKDNNASLEQQRKSEERQHLQGSVPMKDLVVVLQRLPEENLQSLVYKE